jgi:CheY-like chemotaxis protein
MLISKPKKDSDARQALPLLTHHLARLNEAAPNAARVVEIVGERRVEEGGRCAFWGLAPEQGGRIPAVALTAFARSEDTQRALRAGYQSHVAKPVEPSELLTVCASLVGRMS